MERRFYQRHHKNYPCKLYCGDDVVVGIIIEESADGFLIKTAADLSISVDDSLKITITSELDGMNVLFTYDVTVRHLRHEDDKLIFGCHVEAITDSYDIA